MNTYSSPVLLRSAKFASALETIAIYVLRVAARRSPAHLSERLEEEWLALLPEQRGVVMRLGFALGCLWAATMLHHDPIAASVPVASTPARDVRYSGGGHGGGARWMPPQNTGGDAVICNLNTTPLIDVMLVLIVTLIVSVPMMTHAVKINMPPVESTQNLTPPEIINLDIDFDGTVLWNGTAVSSIQVLDGYYRAEAQKSPLPQINLQPDRRAPYDIVAKVLASAQRNGMSNIVFTNTAQFQ